MDEEPTHESTTARSLPWAAAFALVAALLVVATVGDYGVAWDESVQARYGDLSLDYFASGFHDRSYAEFWNLRYYGALFEMVASALGRLDPARALDIRHACIAATWVLAVLAAIRFARLLDLALVPAFACLALATLPAFYGHAFQNSKDMPFAAAFAWSMVAIATWLGRSRPSWRDAALAGVMMGLVIAVRVGGVLVFGFLAVGLACRWWLGIGSVAAGALPGLERSAPGEAGGEDLPRGGGREERLAAARRLLRLAAQTAVVAAIAWALMVATWPFAQEAPIRNPLEALAVATAFPVRFPVLFEGGYLPSDALPGRYLGQLLVMKTPPALLGLALGALVAAILALPIVRAEPRTRPPRATLALVLLVAWVVLPPALFALGRPAAYDGMRHFLFVLPGVALLAACGAAGIVSLVESPRLRQVATCALALILVDPIVDLVRLHPYQMTYFNQFAGGVGRAWRLYDTDYWATSYREGMEWIHGQVGGGREAVVLVAANDYSRACAATYGAPNLRVETIWEGGIDGPIAGPLPPGVDYYLSTTRVGLAANFAEAPIVHTIGRDGAIFAVVRGRQKLALAGAR